MKLQTNPKPCHVPDGWRRTNEAAKAFGVTRTTLVNWRNDKRVRWSKIGGTCYYDISSINQIREDNAHEIEI